MKTDSEKLDFILRAVVTADGPEQTTDMPDEVFLFKLIGWLLRQKPDNNTVMKTDSEKLDFILRAIVTAGGPDQAEGTSDECYILALVDWLLGRSSIWWCEVHNREATAIDHLGNHVCYPGLAGNMMPCRSHLLGETPVPTGTCGCKK